MPRAKLALQTLICSAVMGLMVGCSPASQVSDAGRIAVQAPRFDGDSAYELLKKQVEMGPRYPGAPGHETAAAFIESQLKPYADGVTHQDFSVRVDGKQVNMRNMIAYFNPRATKWVLLAAHWDTRPMADYEVQAEKRRMPIPGANDGASGVAVLLQLARMFKSNQPAVGVMMVFFDGEDYGATEAGMYLGAKHFARNLAKSAVVDGKPVRIDCGILLDMIGDKHLDIYQEKNSVQAAPEIVDKIWATAKDLGYAKQFIPKVKYEIGDDHIPLLRAGVKCVDVIDFDYAPWHTLDDTPDKCSAESLGIVGNVIAGVVYGEKP